MRTSIVLWDGRVGGAERSSVALAGALSRMGVETGIVVVGSKGALAKQIAREGVEAHELTMHRGRQVVRHPQRLRAAVEAQGADVAILQAFGYLGAALAVAGFRGGLIGVEHGVLITLPGLRRRSRAVRLFDRRLGALTHDAEVAVSAYMEQLTRRWPHGRTVVRIPHGVRLPGPAPSPPGAKSEVLTLGFAGRLVPGKGVDVVLRAIDQLRRRQTRRAVRMLIAGDGPWRPHLERLVDELALRDAVRLIGWTEDLPGFWAQCDLAVAANDTFVESFCIAIAEAMASGRPAIVSRVGALPELVSDGETGAHVSPGNVAELVDVLCSYADAPELVTQHGEAAYSRVRREFSLERCATRYHELASRYREPVNFHHRLRRTAQIVDGGRQTRPARPDAA